MRFRWFRSRVFWFGVPGLVGLLWGWWISRGYWSDVVAGGAHSVMIGQGGGEIYVWWDPSGPPDWSELSASHEEKTEEEADKAKIQMIGWQEYEPRCRLVFIPYHWPVLAYMSGWCGLVLWRKRNYRALPEGTGVE